MSTASICGDNRFELIAKARAALIDGTNIEDKPEKMAVLDDVLYRCWQMGWLNKLDQCHADETECIPTRCYDGPHSGAAYHIHVMECSECGRTYEHVFGDYEYCPHCRRRIEVTDG